MNEDLLGTLMRFHREVTMPDMQRLVREPLEEKIETVRTELRSEMLNGFDAITNGSASWKLRLRSCGAPSVIWRGD